MVKKTREDLELAHKIFMRNEVHGPEHPVPRVVGHYSEHSKESGKVFIPAKVISSGALAEIEVTAVPYKKKRKRKKL